jgi:hypothetical protein
MMLNMDLIDSSSESDGSETIDTLTDLDSGDDDDVESASSSSELDNDDSGQCSGGDDVGAVEEDEYDRIFNRGLSTSSNSDDEETSKYFWQLQLI